MNLIKRSIALFFALAFLPASNAYISMFYWSSAPGGPVAPGTPYYIEAALEVTDYSGWHTQYGSITMHVDDNYHGMVDGYQHISYGINESTPAVFEAEAYSDDGGYDFISYEVISTPVGQPVASVVVDGYSNGATINRPPDGSPVTITVRYRATDPDGNLTGIRPQIWKPSGALDNNEGVFVPQSGGSGEVVRTVVLNENGNWRFWTDAQDAVLASTGSYVDSGPWNAAFRITVVQPPQSPNVNFTISATTAYIGQTLSLMSAATDVNGDLAFHGFWWDQGQGMTWTAPDFDYDYPANDTGWSDISNSAGSVANGNAQTITANWTAPGRGTYVFHSNAYDSRGGWGNGTVHTVVVQNRAPSVSFSILDANRSPLSPDANGRVRMPIDSYFYVRVDGTDPDGRLAYLYSRVDSSSGAPYSHQQVSVSGSSASREFGPYHANMTGIWNVWAHASDIDRDNNNYGGNGWATVHDPDIEVRQPNRPPTVSLTANGVYSAGGATNSFSISNGSTLNFSTSASDLDGNFQRTRIWANYENQGWNEIRNVPAGSDSFTYTLTGIGSWQFHCRSLDNDGVESTTAVINVSCTNRAPVNLSLNSLPATMLFGSSVALTSGAHDADGNLAHHMFWRRGPRGNDTFSGDWDGWQNYDDNSSGWSNWSNPGHPSNPTNSSISATFTPPSPGYWQFHANGWDTHNASTAGATGSSVFVAPQPSVNITVSKSQASVDGGGSISVNLGQTVAITSSANAEGWLSEHNIYGYVNGDPGNWFSPSNGGAWLDGADYSTQSNRSVTWQPTSPGTYTLYVEAFTGKSGGERVGGTSGYPGYYDGSPGKRVTVNVIAHESPVVNFSLSSTTLYIGQTLSLDSQASDVNSDMLLHTFWWDQGNGSRWTSPQFQYHEFEPNGEGWSNISNSDGSVANGGNNTITATWTPTLPGVYQFHSNAQDASGGWGNGAEYTVTVPNRTPSVSYSILDAGGNPLTPDGSGRVTVPVHGNYYVRVNGHDPDERLSRLYLRMSSPTGASQNWSDVAVSGANASHDFGPFNHGGTSGVWDVWVHAQDLDSATWGAMPDFNGNNYGWATSGSTDVYSYSGSVPVATVSVDGYSSSDIVPWYAGHPAPTVTVRYRATDADGNLQGVRPQVWAIWREWVWDEYGGHEETISCFENNNGQFVSQSGGNGEVARSVTLELETDWYFWTHAIDANGQLASSEDSGTEFLLKVQSQPNPPPSGISLNSLPSSIKLGEQLNLTSSATDVSGNMSNHMFFRRGPHNAGDFADESWLSYSDAPEYWSNWTAPGHASGPRQSSITATFTPPNPGYWQFHANAWDSMGAWGNGVSSTVVFVAPPPSTTLQAQIGSRIAGSGEILKINSAQSIIVSSTASAQGWLSLHNILGLQNNTPFIPAGGTANLTAAAGLTESKRSITWTPPGPGTYVFYVEASTGNSSGTKANETTTPESNRVTVIVYSAVDSDSDGIADSLENQYGLNPNDPTDSLLDKDNDGLANIAEINLDRNPSISDTDFGAPVGGVMQSSWPAKDTSKTTSVGVTQGAVSVDRSGNANYEIPIFTPRGAKGLEPAISLKYTSGGPNGIVGVGWSLTGFSMITRGASNKALYPTDTVTDDADGDIHDRFFLDGNRLQVVSGDYGADGSEYRTALETFAKIVYRVSGGASWFELWSKDGSHLYYGNTADSIVGSGNAGSHGPIWGWMLNKVEDSVGNYITIDYFNSDPYAVIARPKSIKYTGGVGYAPSNSIDFEYVSRADPFWIQLGQEYERSSEYILNKIIVSGKDASGLPQILRSYQLTYEQSSYTKRSRLKSIQEEGLNGSKLPATEFAWSDDSFGFTLFGSYGIPHSDALLFAGDYNLDGKSDLLQIGVHRERVTQLFLSNGSGLYAAGGAIRLNTDSHFDVGNDNILVGDVTGDGRPDIVAMFYKSAGSKRRRYVFQMDGVGGYSMMNVLPGGVGEETVHLDNPGGSLINTEKLIDMDGSGRLSLFTAESKRNINSSCGYYKLSPDNRFQWTNLGTHKIYAEHDVRLVSATSGLPRFKISNAIVYQQAYGLGAPIVDTGKKTVITARIDDGVLHVSDFIWPGTLPSYANFVNSDQYYISYADKKGTGGQSGLSFLKSNAMDAIYLDVNQDGRDDEIIIASGENPKLKLATGDVVLDPFPNGPSWFEKIVPLDVDGDGRMDLLIRGDPSKGNTGTGYRILKADGAGPTADLITSVTDGLGSITQISYKPLSDSSVYQIGSFADPMLIPLRPTSQVVSELRIDAGVEHSGALGIPLSGGADASYSITYKYEGLYSAPYRGLVGFAKISATDSRTGIETRTEFNQTSILGYAALNGQVKNVSRWRGSILMSNTSYAHTNVSLNSGLTSFAYISSSTSTTFAFDTGQSSQGVMLNLTSSGQTLDDWGNVTSSVVYAGFEGRSVMTDATYWPALTTGGAWVGPRLKTTTTTLSKETDQITDVSSYREIYYRDNDDVTANNTQGSLFYPTKLISDSLTNEEAKRSETIITYGDSRGNVTKVSMAGYKNASESQTREISYTYDTESGRFTEDVVRLAPSSAGGEIAHTATYNQATGLMESSWDANNLATTFSYDDFGRQVSTTGPDGVTFRAEFEWTTSNRGVFAKKASTTGFLNGSTVHLAPPSFAIYDRLGRLTKNATVDADGYPVWSETVFDSMGRVKAQSTASRQLADSNVFWSQYGYDEVGRLNAVITTTGVNVSVTYNRLTSDYTYTGAYGAEAIIKKKRVTRDPAGRTISILNNIGLGQPDERDAISYVYDALGLVAEVNAAGAKRIIYNDFRGLPVAVDEPDAGICYADYNAFGEIYRVKDAKNQTTAVDYDVLGRPKTKTTLEGTTTFAYDTATGKGKGLPASITAPDGADGQYVEAYQYETSMDKVKSVTMQIARPTGGDVDTFSITHSYDSHFRLRDVNYLAPGSISQKVGYRYNGLGALREIRDLSQPGVPAGSVLWGLVDVNDSGVVETEIYGNGLSSWTGYSAADGALRHRLVENKDGFLENIRMLTDTFGNFRERQLRAGDVDGTVIRTESYRLDLLDRLKEIKLDGVPMQTMDYDVGGNLTNKSDVGDYLYNSESHAATSIGGVAIQYDGNGNLTHKGGVQVATWTSFNQPQMLTLNGNSSSFRYGASGNRVQHSLSTGESITYAGSVIEYARKAGVTTPRFRIFGPGGQIAQITAGATRQVSFFAGDHLGSIESVTKQSGIVSESVSFDPWGKRRNADWTAGVPSARSGDVNRGYTGHEMMEHLGLINMNGRVYDPAWGRFLSKDPVVSAPLNPQTYNGYSYVANNPVNLIDPSGFQLMTLSSGSGYGNYDFSGLNVYSSGGGGSWLSVSFSSSSGGLFMGSPVYSSARYKTERFQAKASLEFAPTAYMSLTASSADGLGHSSIASVGMTSAADSRAVRKAWNRMWDTEGRVYFRQYRVSDEDYAAFAKAVNDHYDMLNMVAKFQRRVDVYAASGRAAMHLDAYITAQMEQSEREMEHLAVSVGLAIVSDGLLGKFLNKYGSQPSLAAESRMTTVIGSMDDVAAFKGRPGFNVLERPLGMTDAEFARYNAEWMNTALRRGDDFLAVTDPAAHAQFLEGIKPGLSLKSNYLTLEVPMLEQFGATIPQQLSYPPVVPFFITPP